MGPLLATPETLKPLSLAVSSSVLLFCVDSCVLQAASRNTSVKEEMRSLINFMTIYLTASGIWLCR